MSICLLFLKISSNRLLFSYNFTFLIRPTTFNPKKTWYLVCLASTHASVMVSNHRSLIYIIVIFFSIVYTKLLDNIFFFIIWYYVGVINRNFIPNIRCLSLLICYMLGCLIIRLDRPQQYNESPPGFSTLSIGSDSICRPRLFRSSAFCWYELSSAARPGLAWSKNQNSAYGFNIYYTFRCCCPLISTEAKLREYPTYFPQISFKSFVGTPLPLKVNWLQFLNSLTVILEFCIES